MNNPHLSVDVGLEFVSCLAEELSTGRVELPAFPEVALRIKEALDDPDISSEQIARIICSDPVFSARILKVANSVLINGSGPEIRDIRTAVTRIGFRLAQSTAVSYAIGQLAKSEANDFLRPHLEELWGHSIEVAAYSYVIAKNLTQRINPDEALLAGLLHDIGKYYILTSADLYPGLKESPEILMNIMDEWHTGVGRSILEAWNFSEEFAVVADEHETIHRSKVGPPDLVDIVIIANLLSQQGHNDDYSKYDWSKIPAAKALGLSEEKAIRIMSESVEEIDSIVKALEF